MTTGIRGNATDCKKHYQASLEQQIQQGNWNLVCQDKELFKEMEELLSKGNAQDFHPKLGLDTLSLVEASVKASPTVLCQNKLKYLAKAFEVLELAALNLYMCPWRKEYRVVKMYSGMFTHCVKPALTSKQAKKLFGLLGYQPSGPGEEEELRLSSKSVKADILLQLACAFFIARIECQLLLSAVSTLGGSIKSELQLIQDRKDGNSLHVALDNALKVLEAEPSTSNNHSTDVDATIDIYTDETLASPPSLPYIPPEESALSFSMSFSNTSQVNREKDVKTACDQSSKLSLTQPTKFENEKDISAGAASSNCGRVCNSLQSSSLRLSHCEEIHDEARFKNCQKPGHDVRLKCQQRAAEDQPQNQEKSSKNGLKQHSCMNIPTNNYFLVCYHCHYIHDLVCKEVINCASQRHNVQRTGKLQVPEEGNAELKRQTCLKEDGKCYGVKHHDYMCSEKQRCQKSSHDMKYVMEPNEQGTKAQPIPVSVPDSSTEELQLPQKDKMTTAPERHWCLEVDNKFYVICSTCNKYHDYLCTENERCQKSGHEVKYLIEPNEQESQSFNLPLHYHDCCSSRQPDFVCLTCRIFHCFNCSLCLSHEWQLLKSECTECLNQEFFTLCVYCFKQYCKSCWFKDPMKCKCGKPFLSTNV